MSSSVSSRRRSSTGALAVSYTDMLSLETEGCFGQALLSQSLSQLVDHDDEDLTTILRRWNRAAVVGDDIESRCSNSDKIEEYNNITTTTSTTTEAVTATTTVFSTVNHGDDELHHPISQIGISGRFCNVHFVSRKLIQHSVSLIIVSIACAYACFYLISLSTM